MLGELLRRIMRQEGRHIDFYAAQAKSRLADSRAAQRLTRTALRRLWAPVGRASCPPTRSASSSAHLFADGTGLATAQRIDRHIDRLPGLEGLHLIENSVAELAA